MRCLAVIVLFAVAACADTVASTGLSTGADTGADTGAPAPREYVVPDRLLGYTYSGGTYRPIANTGTGIVSGSSLQSAY